MLRRKKMSNIWKMTYRFMDNIKTYMDNIYELKNGNITIKEYEEILGYIKKGLNNIIK